MRHIVFEYTKGWNDVESVVVEFEDDVTDQEINEEFENWVWGLIGDSVTWFEEEQ